MEVEINETLRVDFVFTPSQQHPLNVLGPVPDSPISTPEVGGANEPSTEPDGSTAQCPPPAESLEANDVDNAPAASQENPRTIIPELQELFDADKADKIKELTNQEAN